MINKIDLLNNIGKKFIKTIKSPISSIQKRNADCSCLEAEANYNKALISYPYRYRLPNSEKKRILDMASIYEYINESKENREIYEELQHFVTSMWFEHSSEDARKCPWKMHIYADNDNDYRLLYAILSKYVVKNDISAKFVLFEKLNDLNTGIQKGKAITIYPKSNDEFKKIAKDLDFTIKANNLNSDSSEITGDRQLGSTGRIFYRYEYNSGIYQDWILNLDNYHDVFLYGNCYEKNRIYNYLADDMSEAEDPFRDLL